MKAGTLQGVSPNSEPIRTSLKETPVPMFSVNLEVVCAVRSFTVKVRSPFPGL